MEESARTLVSKEDWIETTCHCATDLWTVLRCETQFLSQINFLSQQNVKLSFVPRFIFIRVSKLHSVSLLL